MVGKGENAGKQHFLLFPHCFLHFQKQIFNYLIAFILSSANAFDLDQPKILSFDKELNPGFTKINFDIPRLVLAQRHMIVL